MGSNIPCELQQQTVVELSKMHGGVHGSDEIGRPLRFAISKRLFFRMLSSNTVQNLLFHYYVKTYNRGFLSATVRPRPRSFDVPTYIH